MLSSVPTVFRPHLLWSFLWLKPQALGKWQMDVAGLICFLTKIHIFIIQTWGQGVDGKLAGKAKVEGGRYGERAVGRGAVTRRFWLWNHLIGDSSPCHLAARGTSTSVSDWFRDIHYSNLFTIIFWGCHFWCPLWTLQVFIVNTSDAHVRIGCPKMVCGQPGATSKLINQRVEVIDFSLKIYIKKFIVKKCQKMG